MYIYYFIRLSKNLETGEYEIVYIDLEPENYEYEWIMPTNSMIDSWDSDLKGSSITGGD